MTRWLLVRHGETEWNRDGKAQGHADIQLSDVGRWQAKMLAEALRDVPIHVAACSDLTRARETARLILGERDVPLEITPDLREVAYGAWEGLTSEQARARNPDLYEKWLLWDPTFVAPDGGESVQQVMVRVRRFVKRTEYLGDDQTLVVVSHGGTIRILTLALMELPLKTFSQFVLDLASISIIDVFPQRSVLSLWNDTSHYQGKHEG